MALRKWHLLWGFLSFVFFVAGYWYISDYAKNEIVEAADWYGINVIWVTGAFWMAIVGAEWPDWDQMTLLAGIKLFHHRDWFTHSALLPIILTIPFVMTRLENPGDPNLAFGFIFAAFFFGIASHLFLDLWPTMNVDHMLQKKGVVGTSVEMTKGFFKGLTGWGEGFTGTYLIHLPFKMPVVDVEDGKKGGAVELRKTLPKHASRLYCIINGLICIFLGIFLINFVVEFDMLKFLLLKE
ncbi:MAG: metal-dependent hydrolase [Candidatus Hodarchaeota archaeon]